jgi:hypothetical protein
MEKELTVWKPEEGTEFLPDKGIWIGRFYAPSQSSGNIYTMATNKKTGELHCNCSGGKFRRDCPHLTAMAALGAKVPQKLIGTRGKKTKQVGKKPVTSYPQYDTSDGFGDASMWQSAYFERMGLQEAMRHVGGESPFAILGVGAKASWDEIRKAFRALARKFHPDLNPGDKVAEESFIKTQAAYEILEDMHQRGSIL